MNFRSLIVIALLLLLILPASAIQYSRIMDNMTSNTAPSGFVAIANTTRDNDFANYGAWHVFDGSLSTVYESYFRGSTVTFLQVEMPYYRVARMYNVSFPTGELVNRAPSNWTFSGSNDNVTWMTLDTQVSQVFAAPETKSYPDSGWTSGINVNPYKYYKFNSFWNIYSKFF